MSQDLMKLLDEFSVTFEFTVKEVNTLLNVLNTPFQAPSTTLAAFIAAIQQQAGPQVLKAQESLKAVQEASNNADGVPKDLEEKN